MGYYEFEASTCGGVGSYSYEWRISLNGRSNYGGVVSTAQSYSHIYPPGTHFLKLTVQDGAGEAATDVVSIHVFGDDCRRPPCNSPSRLTPLASTGAQGAEATAVPEEFALHAPYPNPFRGSTEIVFDLPERAEVHLAVYDLLGREVALLVNETLGAGVHHARLDAAAGLSSGVYIVRFTAGGYTETRRVVLVK